VANQLVPDDFEVPTEFEGPGFRLEPLGAEHNERDHEAWMSSIDHIRTTPGFENRSWPRPMSLEENLGDLIQHSTDFEQRAGFTYSILDGDQVIGCLYIYPSSDPGYDAKVSSWVTAARAGMDENVWRTIRDWLDDWPFSAVDYAAR
jgi:hypothetical protein